MDFGEVVFSSCVENSSTVIKEPGRLCGRNGSPVSESVSTMTEADKLEEIKQLVLANNQRVNDLIRKGSTKPLKSSRLDVQMRFNEEVVALLEDHADIPNVAEAMASLKARNSLLKKGDTRPEIFRFFDIHRESKPDIPYAACVHEALQDFAKRSSSDREQRWVMSDLLCVIFDCNAISLGRVLDQSAFSGPEEASRLQTSLISDVLALCTSHLSVSIGNRLLFLVSGAPEDRNPKQSPIVFDSSLDLFCDLQEKAWEAVSSALEHSACNGNPTCSLSTSYAAAVSIASCQIARYKRENTCQSGRILLINSSESYGSEMGKLMNLFFAVQKLDILIDVASLIRGPPTLQQACDITGGSYVFIENIEAILVDLMMYMFPDASQRSNFNKPELSEVDYSAICHCHGENVCIAWVCTVCLAVQCRFTPICSVCKSVYKLKIAPPKKLVRPKKRKAADDLGS
ncbi:hypothetical protein QR680_012862 [Steinernema hermaphroditum]|uniref:General transcription factor IIH subunit 3 n=1 Tax=Steinernema hermaphroditum TaxID=289476 RepID=A0AA39M1J2_9BILA|nr:hypothetical protein QR680_012862 [Steinernema hermaphroditum]